MAYINITSAHVSTPGGNQIYIAISSDLPTGVPDGPMFYYQISVDSDFSSLIFNENTDNLNTTSAPLPVGVSYYIRVVGRYGTTSSTVNYLIPGGVLPAPSVTLTKLSDDTVLIQVGSNPNSTGSAIQRSTNPEFTLPDIIYDASGYEFTDTGLPSDIYYYRALLKASSPYMDSAFSSGISIDMTTTGSDLTPPVIEIIDIQADQLTVEVNVVPNGVLYELQYSLVSDFSSAIETIYTGVAPVNYSHSGLMRGVTYYYRARALTNGTYYRSDWSDTESATTLNTLYPPILSITGQSNTEINLELAPYGPGDDYEIQRDLSIDFTSPVTVYTGAYGPVDDAGLQEDTGYYYRSRALAYDDYLSSDWTAPLFAKTASPVPSFSIKYKMQLKDVTGKSFEVNLYFKDFEGEETLITGNGTPINISYTGADDNVYDPIRDFKASINAYIKGFDYNFYNDITEIQDGDCWTEIIDLDDNFKYTGWLISDQFSRSFDETAYEIALTIVSPLSLMKGVEFLMSDGRMYFGNITMSDIISQCLVLTTPDETPNYEIYSELKESEYVGSDDLFKQLKFNIESFNDANGRPPKCYDLIEKICASFKFYCIWENNILKFFDIYEDAREPVIIKIMQQGDNTDFLTGNTENITKTRASKEISLKYEYGRQVGVLPNGRFLDYNAGTGRFNFWQYNNLVAQNGTVLKYINETNVLRVGTGRSVNPYRVRFLGELTNGMRVVNQITQTPFEGLTNYFETSPNENISIKVNYKYFDWKAKYGIPETTKNKQVPYLYVLIYNIGPGFVLDPPDNNVLDSLWWLDYKDIEGTDWQQDTGIETTGPHWESLTGTPRAVRIAVESTTDIQSYEMSFRVYDTNRKIYVVIQGFQWEQGKPTTIDAADQYIDVVDIIATRTADGEGTDSTGQQIYITQKTQSSKIEETEDVYLGNYDNENISGALLKLNDEISTGLTRGSITDKLQNWLARGMMAQKRSIRYKLDCDFKSNTVRMGDVIKFMNGANELLPNKYMLGSYDYDVKNAEIRVTAFELNTEDKQYELAGENFQEPTTEKDMLENYKTYN